jgi:hypothetical protein
MPAVLRSSGLRDLNFMKTPSADANESDDTFVSNKKPPHLERLYLSWVY